MAAFTRADNQAWFDKKLGAGKVTVGSGGGEAALANLSPQDRAEYVAYRQGFDGQSNYQPTMTSGVSPLSVASLDPYQTQALERGAQGYNNTDFLNQVQQLLSGAQAGIQNAVQPMTQEQFTSGVQQYMDPYIQSVVDPTIQNIQKQADIAQSDINALFNQGSFGSSAHRVASQEMADNTGRTIAAATAPLYSQGFTNAVNSTLGQFNQGQAAQLQGYGQFGNLANTALGGQAAGQDLFTMNLNNLLNSGNAYQQQNQNLLNGAFGQLQQQQAYPNQQLTDLINQITGAFSGSTGAATTAPNMLQTLGGAGMALSSGFDNNGGFSFNNLFGRS